MKILVPENQQQYDRLTQTRADFQDAHDKLVAGRGGLHDTDPAIIQAALDSYESMIREIDEVLTAYESSKGGSALPPT